MTTKERAPRMSRTARRSQILDIAVEIITAMGLSSCTLERVAAAARISKPLIYKYFAKREDLLMAVLDRESEYLRIRGLNLLPQDTPFEHVVRLGVERTIGYFYERGPILRLVAGEKSIAALVQDHHRDDRVMATNYFSNKAIKTFGVPQDVAEVATIMTVNAPIFSARALKKRAIDATRAAEIWSEFVLGGWKALEKRYGGGATGPVKASGKRRTRLP